MGIIGNRSVIVVFGMILAFAGALISPSSFAEVTNPDGSVTVVLPDGASITRPAQMAGKRRRRPIMSMGQ